MRELRKSFWDFTAILGTSALSVPLMIFSEYIQAHYLGPEKYGQVALILSAVSLLFLFGLSWLRLSILRFGKEEFIKEHHLRKTTANFLTLSFFSFLIVISFFYSFNKEILNFLEIKNQSFLWVIIFGLLLMTLKIFIFEVLKVVRLIKVQTFLMRLASKIFVSLGILLFVFNILEINVFYVVYIFLLSDFLIIIVGLFFIKIRYLFPLQFDKILLKRMFIFSFPLLFSSWSSYIVTWVDTYVIKYFLTLEKVGIYQAAYKIFNTLRSFILTGIVTVFTPIIMVLKTENRIDKIKKFYLMRIIPQISFFIFVTIAIILLLTDSAFRFIYGNSFHNSVLPFKILITTMSFGAISSLLTPIITSFDMTKKMLYLGIFAGVFNLVADVLLVPRFGILGAAFASFLVFSVNPVIWFFIINKKFDVHRKSALIFPFFTTVMLVINIANIHFIFKLVISAFLIVVVFLVSGKFNLFNKNDIELLNNINMPRVVKSFYLLLINFFNNK